MSNFGEVLKKLRKAKGLTQEQLGERFNITKTGVSYWENGKATPSYEMLENIADYFNVDMNYLLGKSPIKNSYRSELTEIPMENVVFDDYFPLRYSSNLSAGSFEELLQAEPDSVVYVPIVFQGRRKRLHAFKVNGTSMNNVIEDGSIVVAEDTADGGINFKDGTIVVAFLDGKATVKRLYRAEDHVTLMPDSTDKAHMPITITPDQQLFIIGRVIWHMNPDNIAELRY